jgi:hypothetical protein
MLSMLRSLTPKQRGAVIATYLGWTLDAFDFFIDAVAFHDAAGRASPIIPDASGECASLWCNANWTDG